MKWIRDMANRRAGVEQQRERTWKCWIAGGQVGVSVLPGQHYESGGRIQATILARIQQHWQETHTYIRLQTYYDDAPDTIDQLRESTQFEKVATKEKHDYLFLFPDCRERHAWEVILSIQTPVDYGKTVFMFDHRLEDWRQVMSDLYDVIRQQSNPHAPPWAELVGRLSDCRCACYSVDEGLWIAKVDLPQDVVLSIIEGVAREEGIELVVDKSEEK